MILFRRAVRVIFKRPFKSLLLFGIIIILGSVVVGASLITDFTRKMELSFKKNMGASATIQSVLNSELEQGMVISTESKNHIYDEFELILEMIKDMDHVSSLSYRSIANLEYLKCEVCTSSTFLGISEGNFNAVKEEDVSIEEGRFFKESELAGGDAVIIISEDFGIPVDSFIEFQLLNVDYRSNFPFTVVDKQIIDVRVIGTFNHEKRLGTNIKQGYNPGREMYFPNEFLKRVREKLNQEMESAHLTIEDVQIRIDNPDSLATVRESIEEVIKRVGTKDANYQLITSDQEFDNIVGPVIALQKLGNLTFSFSLALSFILLSIVLTYLIMERQIEIGIYRSLGERVSRIIAQFVLEVLVISLIAIPMISLSSQWITSEVNSMLERTLEAKGDLEEFEVYEAVMDYRLLIIGTGTTILISSLIPSLAIVRMDPKEILITS